MARVESASARPAGSELQAAAQAAARHVQFALAVPAALQQVAQQPEAPLRSALVRRKSARLVAASDVAGVLRLVERRQQSGQADPIAQCARRAPLRASAGARWARRAQV